MDFKEIELKYKADSVHLEDFISFCAIRAPRSSLYCCGYDYFFVSSKDDGSFIRHRVGADFNQLTFKRKLTDKNNFIRTENNLTLGKDVTKEQVEGLCQSLGYQKNSSIFKTIYVYDYEKYVLSYYIVYDTDLREQGRFIEIEANESYPWREEKEAWDEITAIENQAKELGIVPQNRVKKSLFEQFRE